MKSAFRIYSDILQLRTEAFLTLKTAPGGMRYAAAMFFLVTLLAGVGIWVGLPAVLQKPLIVERIDQVSALVDRFDREIVPTIDQSLESLRQESLSADIDELRAQGSEITAETIGGLLNQAGITADQFADILSSRAAMMDGDARIQLEQLLAQNPLSSPEYQLLLARLALSPEELTEVISRLGLTEEQITTLQTEVDALPEDAGGLLMKLRAAVEQFRPPLGERFSRFARVFGEWISTPFAVLARWSFFGLLLLVVMKLIGGTGTVRQHLIALFLAGSPLFLLFFTYIPDLTPIFSFAYNLAFIYFGRILAMVAAGWAALILLKSLSVTHELSMWRSLGAIILTWAVIYIVLPLLSFLSVGYVLRG